MAQGHIAITGPHEIMYAERGTAVPTAHRGQQAVSTSQQLVEHLPHGDALTEEAGRASVRAGRRPVPFGLWDVSDTIFFRL